MAFGARSTASRYSGKVSQLHSMPAARAAGGDVLGPLEVAHDERPRVGRAGARVKPQLPMTTVVTPCQHELVPSGSQKTWASMWVWPSTKPGRDHVALGVDLRAGPAR